MALARPELDPGRGVRVFDDGDGALLDRVVLGFMDVEWSVLSQGNEPRKMPEARTTRVNPARNVAPPIPYFASLKDIEFAFTMPAANPA